MSRTGYTGDLGFEVTVPRDQALDVLDAILEAGVGLRPAPVRRGRADDAPDRGRPPPDRHRLPEQPARLHRPRPGHARRSSASAGCSRASATATGRSSAATRSAASWGTAPSRWATVGIVADWQDWDRLYRDAGLLPEKNEHPARPGSRCCTTPRAASRSATRQLHVQPRAPAPHRPGPGPPGAGPAEDRPAPRCTWRSDATTTPPPCWRGPPGCPSSTPRGRPSDRSSMRNTTPVRRDRRRRRPQRPGQRAPTSPRPACAPWSSSAALRRRRRDHRGARPGLPVHDVLLRAEPAPAGRSSTSSTWSSTGSCR